MSAPPVRPTRTPAAMRADGNGIRSAARAKRPCYFRTMRRVTPSAPMTTHTPIHPPTTIDMGKMTAKHPEANSRSARME
jgi:hypothetical protein